MTFKERLIKVYDFFIDDGRDGAWGDLKRITQVLEISETNNVSFTEELLFDISVAGVSLDWLFRGVGEMRISDKEAPGSSKTEIPTRTTSFERLTEFNKEFKAASTHDPIRVVKHVLKIHPPKYKGEIIQEVIDSIEKELSKDYDSFITGLNPKY